MDLHTYLKLSGMTQIQFAKQLDVTVQTVRNYLSWRRKPNLNIAARIEMLTKGKVTVHDLMGYWEAKKDHE